MSCKWYCVKTIHDIVFVSFTTYDTNDYVYFFQVQGDLVVYMNMDTVNMNTMSMNMNTTNNVELQQNGGVTVVGDKTNINYHQPP